MVRDLEEIVEEANELYMAGEVDRAEALLIQALPQAEEKGDLNALASICNTLAGVRRAQGRMDEALELAQRTLALAEEASSPDEYLGYMYDNVAQILNRLERGSEALPYYRKAVELMQKAEEPDLASMSRSLVAQADVHLDLESNEEAEACLAEALRLLREVPTGDRYAVDHYFFDELAGVAIQYTDLLLESGKADEALAILTPLAAQQEEIFTRPENKFAVMMGQGEAAHEMIKKEYGDNGAVPFNRLMLTVQLMRAQHQVNPSGATARPIPEVSDFECRIYTQAPHELGEKHEHAGVLLHLLARETKQEPCFAAAEKHYRRALDLAVAAFGREHSAVEQVLEHLRELYEDTGRDAAEVEA